MAPRAWTTKLRFRYSFKPRSERGAAFLRGEVIMPVKVSDIVDALEMQFDESGTYLDKETGEVITISFQVIGMAEEGESPDTLSDWQQPEFKTAQLMHETPDRFLALPSKFAVHQWPIMEEFSS